MNFIQKANRILFNRSKVQPKHERFQSTLLALERLEVTFESVRKDERRIINAERRKIIQEYAYHERYTARAKNMEKFVTNMTTQFYSLHTQLNSIKELLHEDTEHVMDAVAGQPSQNRLGAKRLLIRVNDMIVRFTEAIDQQLINMIEDYENGFED